MLYDRYYKDLPKWRQLAKWEGAYHGFDKADVAKVAAWYESVESARSPAAVAEGPIRI